MIIGDYVNDLLVGESQENCESLLLHLNKKFPTNGIQKCIWYDGCGIDRNTELCTIKFAARSIRPELDDKL